MEKIIDGKHYFDSEAYFRELCEKNKLASEKGFAFAVCSGLESLEGVLSQMRGKQAFVCLDDTNDGSLVRGRSGGFLKNRTMSVMIIHKFKAGDLADRAEKLGWCRELMRQFVSKMLVDERDLSRDMVQLQADKILSREFGLWFLNGMTGLTFFVDVAEPVNLIYSDEEWMK